jgi:rhomboid family protein
VTSVWRYAKTAPLTYTWLVVLLITTIIQHSIPARHLHALLQKDSTNLHHLASDPIRVLIQSLLWIDGRYWWPYLIVFTLFLAPAERWLGQLRWLVVGLVCHVGATYLSEGYLYWRIQEAVSSPRLIDARDIGVSYFVVGIVGVLTYHVPRRWRWLYLVIALVVFGAFLAAKHDFTNLGHFTALLIGLACYPLTRSRRREPVAA